MVKSQKVDKGHREQPESSQPTRLDRRNSILKAALDCFNNLGFQATTIEEIRARSQASTGSIYHHFVNKEQLAGELYIEGLRDYQQGLIVQLEQWPGAAAGVKAIVNYHLEWISENPDWARYLFQIRHAEFIASTQEQIKEMNRELFRAMNEWLRPHIESQQIIKLPLDLYNAILIGPAQEFARHWLAGRVKTDIRQAGEQLSAAAWRALQPDHQEKKKRLTEELL